MTLIAATWSIVAATVSGRGHQRSRRGSQDAVCVRRGARDGAGFVVAVVCDGCSAGEASEVGAGLGARFVAADLARRVSTGAVVDESLADAAVGALVDELGRIAARLSVDERDRRDVIASCLLFTLQAAVVVDGGEFIAFGVGDGVVRVDGAGVDVGGVDDGAPDCVAYRLLDDLNDHARLRVHARGESSDLTTLTVGSDGAAELAAQTTTLLPSGEAFGGLGLFERDVRFVKNASLATKRIAALGAAAPEDDCSVVVVRRAPRHERGASCA